MKSDIGVIVANRGFFPNELVKEERAKIQKVLKKSGDEIHMLDTAQTDLGAIVTLEDAKKCAKLFNDNKHKIDGIIILLPNFGEERAISDVFKLLDFKVPVLVQASPDDNTNLLIERRRDSFCGKISVCNNLRQYNVPFTLTRSHTVNLESDEFKTELQRFKGICRVVKALGSARIGAIGARPAAFNTVRYSEKILANIGITVETLDLSELYGWIERLSDGNADVKEKLNDITTYINTSGVPRAALTKMAKLGVILDRFVADNNLNATAIQCWTSIEEYFGVAPCLMMSMLSDSLKPSACEVDVLGALSMYALQLASESPSAILDWNNNYSDDPNKCVLFHCSNLPKSIFREIAMDYHEIIASSIIKENTYGTCVGNIRSGSMTFLRLTTDDLQGKMRSYIGEGVITENMPETFGGYGVAEIPRLQELLKYICNNGFEHHVAVNLSNTADILFEAFNNYLGYETYFHK